MGKASADKFSVAGDQFLGHTYQEMDCQQFVENCMKQVGINTDLPGSNAWYRRMTWVGTPEECKAKFGSIPKGALLFIWSDDGGEKARGYKDGLGNATHIGIKTGRNKGAIHSSKSVGKVAVSTFKDKSISGGWNRVGLWDAFDYGEEINALLANKQEGNNSANENVEVVIPMKAIVESKNLCGVNLRKDRDMTAQMLFKIPEGAEVTVLKNDGTWSHVQYGGYTGYAKSEFLRFDGDNTVETITVPRDIAEQFYAALGEALEEGGVG